MGKRTTTRHKEDNTFRFETFEEKLKRISVNVNLSIRDGIGRSDIIPVEEQGITYFFQEIEKWIDLNRTESFGVLLTQIGEDVKTLPQLILQKERLIKVLLGHLENKDNSPSYEPTFAFVTALSRDLGPEFYPYYPQFFKSIIDIVLTLKKPEVIEHGFRCYAYLSKYLRRQIVRDLPQHLKQFAPLLNPKLKNYVVIFACEAFEVVASKYSKDNPDKFLDLVYKILLQNKPENNVGFATLLFAIFKGVNGTLKIFGPGMKLQNCIDYIFKLSGDERATWVQMMKTLLAKLLNHGNPKDTKALFESFENLLLDPKQRDKAPIILDLYGVAIQHDNCAKVPDLGKCVNVLKIVTDSCIEDKEASVVLQDLVIFLINAKGKSSNPEILTSLKSAIVRMLANADLECVQKLDEALQDTTHYFHSYLSNIIKAYSTLETGKELEPSELDNIAVRCISEAVLRQQGYYHPLKKDQHLFKGMGMSLWFYGSQKKLIRPLNLVGLLNKENFNCCQLMKTCLDSLSTSTNMENMTRLFLTYSRISLGECRHCKELLPLIASAVVDQHSMCEDSKKSMFSMLLFFILETIVMHGPLDASLKSFGENVDIPKFLDGLRNVVTEAANGDGSFSVWGLKCLDLLVHYAKLTEGEGSMRRRKNVQDFVKEMKPQLETNLMCGFKIIRTLILSILRNLLEMEDSTSDSVSEIHKKEKEMIDRFLEIEDKSILDPKFSPVVKGTLIEAKVIMENDTGEGMELKKMCLKYTIGLMYSNFNLIWPSCIEVIQLAGANIPFKEFWDIFGPQFLRHYPTSDNKGKGSPKTTILSEDGTDMNEFLERLEELAFAFPEDVRGSMGLQENIDVPQYRVNLWKSMVELPFGKEEYLDIKSIIEKTITNSFEESSIERGFTGEINRTLIPVFQFLQKCDIPTVSVDSHLWEKGMDHLISTPDVQKAVWEFLHAKRRKLKSFKSEIDELIASDTMDSFHKFRIDVAEGTSKVLTEAPGGEKRKLLMDIVIRILIGKERRWKAERRLQSLLFIGGCSAADAKKYVELTVGPGLKDPRISPKALEVKINKIGNCIRAWRYKFPSVMDELLNLVCDLAGAIGNLKKPFPKHSNEDELPEEVFEEQKKGAMKAARLCIVAFFQFLSRFNLDNPTIERIFDTFIWNGLEELKSHSSSNISWILKLFHVWSSHDRFHILFAKCKEEKSPMAGLFALLEGATIHFDVKKFILQILLNLTKERETEEEGEKMEHLLEEGEKFDGRSLTCTGIHEFPKSEHSIGLNIVLLGKRGILNLFQDPQLFKKIVDQPGGHQCLSLISKLVQFENDNEDNTYSDRLCSIIIETVRIYKNNEENLFNCLVACKSLMEKVKDKKSMILKLSNAFIWINGRRLRSALCDVLSAIDNQFTFETIRDMNAWSDTIMDAPEFSVRQEAFRKLEDFVKNEDFDRILWSVAAANCFYNMFNEADIGMRNSAKELLLLMSSSLPTKSIPERNEINDIKEFLDSLIIPQLRRSLHQRDENRFADFLQVYISFVQNMKEVHGTFKELSIVLTPEIIEGLTDIQIHLRTRAMNKLCNKLKEGEGKNVSPLILKSFVMPLASHNLLDEEKLGQNRDDLIHSSIETYKAILELLPHEHYFKCLIHLLNSPKKKTSLAKQYERMLVASMDAFHYDLTAAEDGRVGGKEETSDKAKIENGEEEIKTNEEEEGEDESEDDEVDAPSTIETNTTLLSKPAAIKCLRILKNTVIPKLRSYLNFEEKATHKLSRSQKNVDDDVILRIPCTLALVKLLKKLPKLEGEASIRSIMPCLCAGLRNELYSTRHSLRKTILSVIKELGISQLRSVVGYMKATLQRGYQRHVLNFTIGYFLKCLEPELRNDAGSLPIKEILPLCEEELYGVMQEEKDVAAIKAKTKEAAKNNAHPILKLCAKCIQHKGQLDTLIEPAVRNLMAKRSPKVVKTSRQWLASISEGLADNVVLSHLELIDWLKKVMAKENEEIKGDKEEPEAKKRKKERQLLVETKDPLLVPQVKRKGKGDYLDDGKNITGQILLVTEFVFTCLYNGLNKSTRMKEALIRERAIDVLDPFVKPLGEGIQSSSKQVNIVALRCLTLMFEFDLGNFKDEDLVDRIRRNGFTAMNNHCYKTMSDTQMSNATFKFLAAFFMRFPEYKIVVQDFELMLKCIQGYLTNDDGSTAAITLLKGVLKNCYKSPSLQDLMEEVFKQAIQSLYQHINEGCRQAYLIYLNNYCTNPKELTSQIHLILNQFDYQIENGRLTSVEIMNSLLSSMPQSSLEEVKELVFLKAIVTLDREEQKSVRHKLGDVLRTLFKNESASTDGKSKSLVRLFLKLVNSGNHNTELDTFFLVASLLVDDPNIFVGSDFVQLISKIEEILNPESFEDLCTSTVNMTQQTQDYIVFQALNCFRKSLERKVNKLNLWQRQKGQLSENVEAILRLVWKTHLLYEHVWVPSIAVDILFRVLNNLEESDFEKATKQLEAGEGKTNNSDSLLFGTVEDLKVMTKNVWTFLKLGGAEHGDEVVMKGTLVFVQLACIISRLKSEENKDAFGTVVEYIRISVNHEVVKDPKNTRIRSLAFACLRGIVNRTPPEPIRKVAETLTRMAVRELTDEGIPNELRMEAEKLTTILRNSVGATDFNMIYAKANDFFHKKRNLNKAKKKESFVLNPEKLRKRPKKSTNDSKIPFKMAKKGNKSKGKK